MKRKVAKIGPSTLMISLPSKWCKHFNIQKGSELELEEQGSEIRVRTNENKALMETTVDIRNLSERTIKWALGVPYKKGYDSIIVLHNPQQLNLVNEHFKNIYIGFIVADQSEEKTVFKKVSFESENEFDQILRRTFLVSLSLAENVTNALKEKKAEKLKEYIALERTNNLLVDHSHRLLVKFGYKDQGKTSFYFLIGWNLEKIADEYKYIIKCVSISNEEPSQEVLEILTDVKDKFNDYYKLFYKFDIEELNTVTNETKTLIEKISKMDQKNKIDVNLINHSLRILDRLDNFSSAFVGVNLE